MRQIGMRAFKEHASEILRDVRERGESVEVTYRGRAIARVVPVSESRKEGSGAEFLERWKELGKAISAEWPEGLSAVDAIREDRRDL